MYSLDKHEQFMLNVIELAKKGRGCVFPNPIVGCLIVKNNSIIGEGYHEKYGESHAEINALNNCSENPSNSSLYVNLEPCSFFGKTPPCVDAIISHSIKNVYIGIKDPNEKVDGLGIDQLKKAGINVFCGILEKECYEINIGFFNWIKTGRPWVIAKVAESINGYMGIESNKTYWITGKDSRKNVHKLRSRVDGILIGRNTAEVDNPKLTVREILGHNPIRIIADTYRKLSLNLNIFKDFESKNIVLCSNKIFESSKTSFCKYLTVNEKDNLLDVENILDVLGNEGITSIVIEGGAKLLDSFLKEKLIDEMHIYTSNDQIENGMLKNPLSYDDNWNVISTKEFDNDNLVIVRKKELCLQE